MKYITATAVARLLRLRVETVYRHARTGRLPAVKIGGSWRFPREALESSLTNGGTPPRRRGSPSPPDSGEDPILRVIGIGRDGKLTRDLDRELYGRELK